MSVISGSRADAAFEPSGRLTVKLVEDVLPVVDVRKLPAVTFHRVSKHAADAVSSRQTSALPNKAVTTRDDSLQQSFDLVVGIGRGERDAHTTRFLNSRSFALVVLVCLSQVDARLR